MPAPVQELTDNLAGQTILWPWLLLAGSLALLAFTLWQLRSARACIRELSTEIELLTHRRRIVFDFLHDLGEAFTEGIDLNELLKLIANFSVSTTQASAGAVFLFDREKRHLHAQVVVGPFPPPSRPPENVELKLSTRPEFLEQLVRAQTIPVGEGLIGEVAATGKPVLIQDGRKDARLVQYRDPALQTRTAIFIPLKFKTEVLGVMAVVNKQAGESAPFFNANDLFLLDSLADHAAISLYNTTLYTKQAEQEQLAGDLRVASGIQRMLLPDHAPAIRNFDIAGHNTPAQHVGGDYYDFLPVENNRVGVVIADVSGKAVPGALVMMICRSAFRAQSGHHLGPAEMVRRVNRILLPDLREDMFITMLYGVLDGDQRTFTFVRAGHDPALWYRADSGHVEVVKPHGTAVGLARGAGEFGRAMEERRLNLAPRDVLLLYTDGITESLDATDREFGREQLIDVLKQNARESAHRICEIILERLREFTDNAPLHDDRTLVVIKAV